MSANLTLKFKLAEKAYRRASTPQEELRCLETMLSEIPKHKGTDKMQADLKQKISKLKTAIDKQLRSGVGVAGVNKVQRQGSGQVVVLGGPNSGKSQLLASLTRAKPAVDSYPFTTRELQPGMMSWKGVSLQLIDTPPITSGNYPAELKSLVRGADLVLLLLDLGSDDGGEQLLELLDTVQSSKTRLGRETCFAPDEIGVSYTRTLLLRNKSDLAEAQDRAEFFQELIDSDFDTIDIEAQNGSSLAELREKIFDALEIIRVYTKLPDERQPDLSSPLVIRKGETLLELAMQIHAELAKNMQAAKVWKLANWKQSGDQECERVLPHYQPADEDIVELICR